MPEDQEVEDLVEEFGEQWRRMIVEAMEFKRERLDTLGLRRPIKSKSYIKGLITNAEPGEPGEADRRRI